MSDAWYSAAELAGFALPGMPTAERALRRRAQREEWLSRKRAGRGGGVEFPVSALPKDAQRALFESLATSSQSGDAGELILASPASLDDDARCVMEARLYLLGEVERLRRAICKADGAADDGKRGRKQAQIRFAEMADQGELPTRTLEMIAAANQRSRQTIGYAPLSEVTLRRWWRHHEQHGETGLVPRQADQLNPEWLWSFMRFYRQPSKPSIRQAHEAFAAEYEGRIPPYSTVAKAVGRLPAQVRQQGRMGPREMKTIRAFTVRTTETLLPADVYTADGHCADFEVAHPYAAGQVIRPEIISVVDIKTRVCVGWAAGLAESSDLVANSLRAASARAIPAIFYVDHGAGFKNEAMAAAETGVLQRLGATLEHSLPYNSQARGVGERFHKSVWVRAGRDLPTFVGADMDREAKQRVVKRSRQELAEIGASSLHMDWPDFIAWGEEVIAAYNARPHFGLPRIVDPESGKRRHMAPAEMWSTAEADGWTPEIATSEELDMLFRPHELRQTTRGQVRLFNKHYFSDALTPLHGREVRVGYDLHDATRVWVSDDRGRLVCVADLDGNSAEYFSPETVAEARQRRRTAGRLRRIDAKRDQVANEGRGVLDAGSNIEILPIMKRPAAEEPVEFDDRLLERAARRLGDGAGG